MASVERTVSPAQAAEEYTAAHRGQELPLPDVIQAVAGLSDSDSDSDTDSAKSALFWLIDKGRAGLTSTFMVAFLR